MRFLKSQANAPRATVLQAFISTLLFTFTWALALPAFAQSPSEIYDLRLTKLDSDLALSARVKFDLPSVVEEAMHKGVSLTFVTTASLTRGRWYWFDKQITQANRHIRISYQALTRRWRVTPWIATNITSQNGGDKTGFGVQLAQSFDSLSEALDVAQRIVNWRIAPLRELNDDATYTMQLHYELDLSRLPKPLQIGLLGQESEWAINANTQLKVRFADAMPQLLRIETQFER